MAKIMDPILPILFVLGCWTVVLGSFGGPGRPPNVPLLRALWSLLDGIWGLLEGSWGVLVSYSQCSGYSIMDRGVCVGVRFRDPGSLGLPGKLTLAHVRRTADARTAAVARRVRAPALDSLDLPQCRGT